MASQWEIGDAIPLTWEITVGGVATNATVTLTVTLPDGTMSSPAVSNPSTGNYSASFAPTVNGEHKFRWVATGAATAAESGTFTVGGILTVAQAKMQLGKSLTADDVELQDWVDSINTAIEHMCGPVISRTVSEWHTPVGCVLWLRQTPIVNVTTVTAYEGATAQTYTECTTPATAGTRTYLLEVGRGALTRLTAGGAEMPWFGRVLVAYVVGLNIIPSEMNLAARMILQQLWRTQNGGAGLPALSDEELVEADGFDYLIPKQAYELLAPYARLGGFA